MVTLHTYLLVFILKMSADELTDQLDGQRNVAPLHFVNEDVYDEIKFAIFYDCRRFVSVKKYIREN